ncbi:MAG TPA: AsmA family protein [Candidatus Saccharimonadales bacterium]|jgi:AsmA protein|nr:AsmA family protein [Candidatus Saccharimonadales bacterium]
MKRFLIVASVMLAAILLIALVLPFLINVDGFRPAVEQKLSTALGRTVHIGHLQVSLFSGGAEASEISISDDPAFGSAPFLQASSLQIGLQWLPLIFSRQFKVTGLTARKPEILLLKNNAGRWNFSTLGAASGKREVKAASGPAPEFSVAKIEIQDGKIRIANANGRSISHEQTYQKVNLLARDISSTTVAPFTLSAVTPGGGALEVEGQAGPMDTGDLSRTPLEAKVTLDHTDLAAAALSPASGLGGTLDFDAKIKSDGRRLHSEGKAKANNLRLVKGGSPARQAVRLDYNSEYMVESQIAAVNATVHTGNSQANANGTVHTRGESAIAHLKLTGKNMAVNDVEGILPAFGIVMPPGASLQGGTINLNLNADGPLDRLVITGPTEVKDTHLNGYNLNSKLGAIAAFTGIQPSSDTLIQTFSSALRVAPEGIHADSIVLEVPSIGLVTGNGIISGANVLDFKMLLKPSNAAGGGLLGRLSGATSGGQSKGIPFLIKGTTSNPSFLPALGGVGDALKSLQGSPGQNQGQDLGGILGNFLNKDKKKKP